MPLLQARCEGHIEVCGLNGHQFALTRFTHDDLSARLPEDGVLIQRKYVANSGSGSAAMRSKST